MTDCLIRKDGCAGRITLNRPDALNALTPDICRDVLAALNIWAKDAEISLVLIDGNGSRAFCAGGDIAQVYAEGRAGNAAYAKDFWRLEYQMNAALYHFPKPVVSFLHGFTLGGGVGVGCHASHRVVEPHSKIALPECAIGLVTDVGGTLILARAPGRLGAYIAATAYRMGPEDAILTGFADYLVELEHWDSLKATLCETGDPTHIERAAQAPSPAPLATHRTTIDACFDYDTLGEIIANLRDCADRDFGTRTLNYIQKNDPLAVAASLELIARARRSNDIDSALEQEYRFTSRAVEHADFLEGIRARIIDKDNAPAWTYSAETLPQSVVAQLLAPLDAEDRLR